MLERGKRLENCCKEGFVGGLDRKGSINVLIDFFIFFIFGIVVIQCK
jgi:hypothetical protein